MFRKVKHIIISLLLLVSTTGMTFSMHYCGGELISTSINKEIKSCCNDECGCCKNEFLRFEVEDDFINSLKANNIQTYELELLFPILYTLNFEMPTDDEIKKITFNDSSPPKSIQTRIAILQTYLC